MTCPIPLEEAELITLAHGGGGKQTSRLLEEIFLPAFGNSHLNTLHDGALLNIPTSQIVFTTDSYVVDPIFFPGGDIGKLAILGSINDLAMCGAKPAFMSCGFIIEEGFSQSDLKRIVASMKEEADRHSLSIVTGDTKVIERQTGRNIFINTSAIGIPLVNDPISPRQIQIGDAILLSGDIGRHGMAIMAAREKIDAPLISDCASLLPQVQTLLAHNITLHCLRDLTRGGLATALVELSESSHLSFFIEEEAIPVSEPVNALCEILGFDPLYVANEGRFIAFIPQAHIRDALTLLPEATLIGHVTGSSSSVTLKNAFGTERYLYKLSGNQLPRIC
jgi:hydrogenase expression/formation protein HypE